MGLPSQRLLALLSLANHRLQRSYVAGTLWPDATEMAARSDLRSAIWKLDGLRHTLIESTSDTLRLRPGVLVDYHWCRDLAHHLLQPRVNPPGSWGDLPGTFKTDLLPDWGDRWLESERESYRQLRLHVLETVCVRLTERGRFAEALEAGLLAVSADPLRESAHRAVIRALLLEGNRGEALRRYRGLWALLDHELGVQPSFRIQDVLTAPVSGGA